MFNKLIVQTDKSTINEINRIVERRKHDINKYINVQYRKFACEPQFYSVDDIEKYEGIIEELTKLLKKFWELYINDKEVRAFFGYDAFTENLLLANVGYATIFPILRVDVFHTNIDTEIKICEINSDGSTGLKSDLILNNDLLSTTVLKEIQKEYDFIFYNNILALVESNLFIYSEFRKTQQHLPYKPNVAIVNFKENNDLEESNLISKYYQDNGLQAYVVDPRELSIVDRKIMYCDVEIHLIHKELINTQLILRVNELSEFIEILRHNNVCIVGNFKSLLIDSKKFFAALHDTKISREFSLEEKEFIKKHISYTRIFEEDEDLYNEVIVNKDKYVLKHDATFDCKGVYIGQLIEADNWKEIVKRSFGKNYIVQEFIETRKKYYYVVVDDKLVKKELRSVIGLFCFNDKLSGFFTRAGTELLVNGGNENDYYLGNIIYKNKFV